VTITVTAQGDVTVSSGIGNGTDDVEESAAGVMYITSTDIELVYDSYNSNGNQVVGLRFQNLGIPGNATIKNAFVQFTVDEAKTGTCALTIKGEASDNSSAFTSSAFDVSGRSVTTAAVSWSPVDWTTVGESGVNQRTPELKNILQEIVNRSGYAFSSAISIIITGTGTRTAKAYEVSTTQAARLFVTYSTAPETNFIADATSVGQGSSVHFTDQSTHEPTSWSWSFPGGTPATSAVQNPTIAYNTPGVYSVTLTATNSGGSCTFTRENYVQVTSSGYCSSQSNNFSLEYINKFTLGSFVNSSGGSNYTDFTNLTIPLQTSKKYTVFITPKFTSGKKPEYFKVWIDYNMDQDFTDAGENVITGTKNGELRATFTTPSNIAGTTRMRVAMKRDSYSGPCDTFTYGEVEDYTVSFGTKTGADAGIDYSLKKASDPGIKIYPNPATQNLYFEKPGEENCELEIYSVQGQLVWESVIEIKKTMIDISKLQPGLYLIKYIGSEGVETKKLVIF
jgi:PKD repeat protein